MLTQQNALLLLNRSQAEDERARAGQALLSREQALSRLSAVDRQTAQLRLRLASIRAAGGIDQRRLAAAQLELDTLRRQRGAIKELATDEQIKALEDHRRRLAAEIEGL